MELIMQVVQEGGPCPVLGGKKVRVEELGLTTEVWPLLVGYRHRPEGCYCATASRPVWTYSQAGLHAHSHCCDSKCSGLGPLISLLCSLLPGSFHYFPGSALLTPSPDICPGSTFMNPPAPGSSPARSSHQDCACSLRGAH